MVTQLLAEGKHETKASRDEGRKPHLQCVRLVKLQELQTLPKRSKMSTAKARKPKEIQRSSQNSTLLRLEVESTQRNLSVLMKGLCANG